MGTKALIVIFLYLVPCILGGPINRDVEVTYEDCEGVDCVCFDELGCFLKRSECEEGQGTLLPQSPDEIRTQFLLFTSATQTNGVALTYDMTEEEFLSAGFDPARLTKFVIHGFINSAESAAIADVKDALLQQGNYNVIMVNWEGGADIGLVDLIKFWTLYRQASQNTRVVAKQLHLLLERLHAEFGGRFEYGRHVHLIGHSLGAQIAGLAAGYLDGKVGRISGLDPAKPNFEGKDRVCRLDETDARFVDVIHSDIEKFGTNEQSGDIDFWPNGGANQPGCRRGLDMFGCSHGRSLEFYAISIEGGCHFISRPCDTDDDSCTDDCPSMGLHADRSTRRGNFCLSTLSKKPYC